MERDAKLTKLIRESGIVRAPDRFSEKVMEKIIPELEKKPYKPLIGRSGRILIILGVLLVVTVAVLYYEPGGGLIESTGFIPEFDWQLPKVNLNFDFLSNLNISAGIASGFAALLILVLSDAGIKRRRRLV
jgi:hypothetical protein